MSTLDLATHTAADHPAAPDHPAADNTAAAPLAVTIRRAGECDRAALARMFARCTVQTRYRRFHGHVNALPAGYLTEALSGGAHHLGLVAASAAGPADASAPEPAAGQGDVVALASCRTVAPRVADLGILVEDGWQRLGIGAALLHEIVSRAGSDGIDVLTAQVLAEQSWILRLLGAHGRCESVTAQGVLEVTVRLSVLLLA